MTSVEPTMRIYSGPLSMFGAKAEIAAREKGLNFELIMVRFVSDYEPKHPEVVRINPKQQVPVLVHGDLEIFDSTQIFEYLEDLKPVPALWPSGPAARAWARILELKSDEVFFAHIIRLMNLRKNPDAAAAAAAKQVALAYYREMEAILSDRRFLAGSFSYADIAFYMAQLFAERMGVPLDATTPALLRWRDAMSARPAVRSVVRPMVKFLYSSKRPVPDFLADLAGDAAAGREGQRPV
ncbi:glutathione S-transferase family protein [Bradyrhizobium zhanjiangense]|nr:glutathione S-transferase family protein [Bradyrhizobium zhanjiangense]